MQNLTRRNFLITLATSSAFLSFANIFAQPAPSKLSFNCFSKHLQWLDYDNMALVLKNAGYNGVDLTVRPGGHVEPQRVKEDLPRAITACQKAGLAVPMIVTAITRADEPFAAETLQTAAQLGVRIYRMGYLRYDDQKSVHQSIHALRPQVLELADLNRQLGISGAYQNHAGTNIGGPVWDLVELLDGVDAQHLGVQYDVKHATAEGGRSWILGLKLIAPHINSLVLKDFIWQQDEHGKWRDTPVPLGKGMVDYALFFRSLQQLKINVPVTLHLEYKLPHELYKDESEAELMQREITVYRRDLEQAKLIMHA